MRRSSAKHFQQTWALNKAKELTYHFCLPPELQQTLFKPFEPMCDIFTNDDFKYDFQNKDVIFMRWKEHFLVPDHRVEGITGASFAGFYYICYNMSKGEIEGYYYHQSSEK